MKFHELYDLQEDLNRLFLAGSKYAQIDVRIRNQVGFFLQSELLPNAPVNKKLAVDLEDMATNPNPQYVAGKVMDISILIHSILYAHGETTLPNKEMEEKKQIPIFDINKIDTNYSYLQLKPVMEAFRFRSAKRLEILKKAFEQKLFDDIRLYPYLEKALDDSLPEVRTYVKDVIMPSITKFFVISADAYY
jgi:hypothetical protein